MDSSLLKKVPVIKIKSVDFVPYEQFAIVDSGAQVNLIKLSVLPNKRTFISTNIDIRSATGESITVVGTTFINLLNKLCEFIVVNDNLPIETEIILGSGFLKERGARIDYSRKIVEINGINFPFVMCTTDTRNDVFESEGGDINTQSAKAHEDVEDVGAMITDAGGVADGVVSGALTSAKVNYAVSYVGDVTVGIAPGTRVSTIDSGEGNNFEIESREINYFQNDSTLKESENTRRNERVLKVYNENSRVETNLVSPEVSMEESELIIHKVNNERENCRENGENINEFIYDENKVNCHEVIGENKYDIVFKESTCTGNKLIKKEAEWGVECSFRREGKLKSFCVPKSINRDHVVRYVRFFAENLDPGNFDGIKSKFLNYGNLFKAMSNGKLCLVDELSYYLNMYGNRINKIDARLIILNTWDHGIPVSIYKGSRVMTININKSEYNRLVNYMDKAVKVDKNITHMTFRNLNMNIDVKNEIISESVFPQLEFSNFNSMVKGGLKETGYIVDNMNIDKNFNSCVDSENKIISKRESANDKVNEIKVNRGKYNRIDDFILTIASSIPEPEPEKINKLILVNSGNKLKRIDLKGLEFKHCLPKKGDTRVRIETFKRVCVWKLRNRKAKWSSQMGKVKEGQMTGNRERVNEEEVKPCFRSPAGMQNICVKYVIDYLCKIRTKVYSVTLYVTDRVKVRNGMCIVILQTVINYLGVIIRLVVLIPMYDDN